MLSDESNGLILKNLQFLKCITRAALRGSQSYVLRKLLSN